jgi:hypothetical protein
MAFVCLFLYFAIADPMLAGGTSSRALQCASLALAGIAGEWAWAHARRKGLVDARVPVKQLDLHTCPERLHHCVVVALTG